MERTFGNGAESDDVTMFIGTEVEHTPAYGLRTLFVVGHEHDSKQMVMTAQENGCEHIYIGANMSFEVYDPNDEYYMDFCVSWYNLISAALAANLWVTVDFKPEYAHAITNTAFPEHERFIPMISVRLPHINALGPNACIKLDDADFKFSNPGVWVTPIQPLMTVKNFTDWDQYTKDEPL